MKKLTIIFVLITIVAGMFLLTGCDSQDPDVVGTWRWEHDASLTTTFNEDGSGTHSEDFFEMGTTFRWATSGTRINWNYPGHPRVYTPYTVENDVLQYTLVDGSVLRFFRVS